MYISKAICRNEDDGKIYEYLICDMSKYQINRSQESEYKIIVDYHTHIVDYIFNAVSKNKPPTSFKCNNIEFTLLSYISNNEERNYNTHRKNYIVCSEKIKSNEKLYVYTQRCRCTSCYAEWGFGRIINVCGSIRLCDDPAKRVKIDMHKCKNCGKYFIDYVSFENYQKQYGKLLVRKIQITGNESEEKDSNIYYNPDSILSRNGYSTKVDEKYRRQILVNMMEQGINKAEIIDMLVYLISDRSRFPNACMKWRADLQFVRNYVIGTLPIVYFK